MIELLVVISIIALLIGILLPALSAARATARAAQSLSNIRQMGIAVTNYAVNHNGFLPMHSSSGDLAHPAFADPRTRWPDHLWDFNPSTEIYQSPNLTAPEWENFGKVFAHTDQGDPDEFEYHGGYGYNFQYLGNSRFNPTIHARLERDVRATSQTIVIGDTAGSRGGDANANPGDGGEAVYVLDPPLPGYFNGNTSRPRAHPSGARWYYPNNSAGDTDEFERDADTYLSRAFPAERNQRVANFMFADGHGEGMTLDEIDDFSGDGQKDNGYWNGLADPNVQ